MATWTPWEETLLLPDSKRISKLKWKQTIIIFLILNLSRLILFFTSLFQTLQNHLPSSSVTIPFVLQVWPIFLLFGGRWHTPKIFRNRMIDDSLLLAAGLRFISRGTGL